MIVGRDTTERPYLILHVIEGLLSSQAGPKKK
jgi:hypothetical protein